MSLFRRHYGAGPLHLLAHLAVFLLAGYSVAQVVGGGKVGDFAVWFVGAAVVHDLVFFPLYSALDRLAARLFCPQRRITGMRAVNYIRVPALLSGLLLLIYFPLILGLADDDYFRVSGHHLHGYARNWALITAGLFAGSALLYLIRVGRWRLLGARPRQSSS